MSSSDPVKVFVGTSPDDQDEEACLVLEHTLRKHATRPVEVAWLRLGEGEWASSRWPTPWSGLRWAVPELCGWRGRAVYFDCPQIIMGDVAELEGVEFPPGAAVLLSREGRSLHLGCMVWDCAAAKEILPPLTDMRGDLGAHQAIPMMLAENYARLISPLPRGWGLRDRDYARAPHEASGSVHCENPYMQPHTRLALPRLRRAGRAHWFDAVRIRHFCPGLVELFDREYAEAIAPREDTSSARSSKSAASAKEHMS